MKLGTETGSLVNHVASREVAKLPEVGDGATLLGWSDRYPATVIEVFKKGKFDYIVVQEDSATRIDDNGMSEVQDYEYTRNPNGRKETFRVVEDRFERVYRAESGRFKKESGYGLWVGRRESYHDFSF